MAYDDGYYYGQCKIVAVVDDAADNGKTVLITTDDNKTYSGTIANKRCEFLLPPRTLYTVQKVSGESAEFTTKVEAGYGDCILVHLDTGYVEVKQKDIVCLDYIKAATADDLKNKVPEANAVKELNSNLKHGVCNLIGFSTEMLKKTIYFDTPFETTPNVVISPTYVEYEGGDNLFKYIALDSITTESFTIVYKAYSISDSWPWNVNWIAMA